MIQLTHKQTTHISGGFLPAIAAFVAILVLPKVVNEHRKEYNQWGHAIGEAAWEHNHPYDPNK